MRFTLARETFAILRLHAEAAVPSEVLESRSFFSITRTAEELSIVTESSIARNIDTKREDGWRLLKLEGPIPFETTGVAAAFTRLLANRGISVFVISTFDTDYVLVKSAAIEEAVSALRDDGGHRVYE
jgi:uncharacterized protein